MKVKRINSSSIKTNNLIRKTFAELMKEKKELSKITVTELVKRADITRSTFYTHYCDIYDLANEYQEETLDMINDKKNDLNTIDDIFKFSDKILSILKENESTYRMLLTSDEPLLFIEKLKKISCDKIFNCLVKNHLDRDNLYLDVHIYVDGTLIQILRYFREKDHFSLDEINDASKTLFKKVFLS